MKETTANNDAQTRENTTSPICPKCNRPMQSLSGTPINFCSECGIPVTPDPVQEQIVSLMLNGLRDDVRGAVARLKREEPAKYNRLAAIITGGTQ